MPTNCGIFSSWARSQGTMGPGVGGYLGLLTLMTCGARRIEPIWKNKKGKGNGRGSPRTKASIIIIAIGDRKIKRGFYG